MLTIFFRRTECSSFVHSTTPYIHPRPDFDWPGQFRLLFCAVLEKKKKKKKRKKSDFEATIWRVSPKKWQPLINIRWLKNEQANYVCSLLNPLVHILA